MKIKSGRDNLACTIFVPFDCKNNCRFCTSKKMYSEMKDSMNLEKILSIIDKVNYNPEINEYVLTGGEPFSNIESLKIILSHCKKTVYINTTLPNNTVEDAIEVINEYDIIGGVNISRHMSFAFEDVGDIKTLDKITKPVRINTVIDGSFDFVKFKKFVEKYGNWNRIINLRADYRKIDKYTLKVRDDIDDTFLTNYEYRGSTSCMVCNTEFFRCKTCNIAYHRGLMHSSFVLGDIMFVNDIIVTPDGKVHHDWDFNSEENKEFLKWCLEYELPRSIIMIEENDIETLERIIKEKKNGKTDNN